MLPFKYKNIELYLLYFIVCYRGGAEHGLGIYVSEVEVGSEAHLHGLKAGDQILKVAIILIATY